MKRMTFVTLLFFWVISVYAENTVLPPNGSSVFVKYESAWFFMQSSDLGKQPKDVKNKMILYFGNRVTVTGSQKVGDTYYLNVQLPDNSKIWGPADYFATKFITIIDSDLPCFSQPDQSYRNRVKLQPGYFGYYVKEVNNFVNVDIMNYAIKNDNEKPTWIGNVWIKTGYSENINTAMQATYLKSAYNLLYGKTPDVKNALAKLKEGLEVNNQAETEITPVISALIEKLQGGTPAPEKTTQAPPPEMNTDTFYTTTFDNLRFRESSGVDGVFIRMLVPGEKLKLLEKGDEAVINNVKGNWCKFETESGETGWAFSAYLTPLN